MDGMNTNYARLPKDLVQAIEEAANPKDFLIAHDINMNDRLRGLAHYAVAAIRYWIVGGWAPLSLRLEVEFANIRRQIGPERLAESKAFLEEEPFGFSFSSVSS